MSGRDGRAIAITPPAQTHKTNAAFRSLRDTVAAASSAVADTASAPPQKRPQGKTGAWGVWKPRSQNAWREKRRWKPRPQKQLQGKREGRGYVYKPRLQNACRIKGGHQGRNACGKPPPPPPTLPPVLHVLLPIRPTTPLRARLKKSTYRCVPRLAWLTRYIFSLPTRERKIKNGQPTSEYVI